ncbi:MAG: alpha/beta hydrolase [Bacteroidales bacterium]|nr:alpha/beta hydrolase [Bacteroidales bacterium]
MRYLENTIRITPNKIKISFYDEGPKDAPAIIFIHGFPFNKSMWTRQMEELKANYRVIAYDIRGYGHSDDRSQETSIDLFASDLILIMDTIRLDKAILCGLSMGGYIALSAISKYPGRFEALVLCDTSCMADTPETKAKRMLTIASIKKNGTVEYAEEVINNLFAPEAFTTIETEIAVMKEEIAGIPQSTLCKTLFALAGRKETCNRLSGIKVPVLIMVGSEDKVTPVASAKYMHDKVKGSVLVVLEHAGHISNMENHTEFNNQLQKFLSLSPVKSKYADRQININ